MTLRKTARCLAFLALAACSDDPDRSADTTGATDTTSDGDTAEPPQTAIVDRTPAVTHTCSVTAPVTQVSGANWRPEALVAADGATWLLRADETALVLSPLAADGTLGSPSIELDPEDYAAQFGDAAVVADDRIAVAWRHDDTQLGGALVRVAIAKTDGQLHAAPRDLPGTSGGYVGEVRVVAGVEGAAIVFYTYGESDGETSLWRRAIAADGTIGEPTAIAAIGQTYGTGGFEALRTSDGDIAVAYTTGGYDAAEVELIRYDPSGVPRGEAKRISREGGQGWRSSVGQGGLHELDGKLWVAWVESWMNDDFVDSQGTVTTKLAALDGNGAGLTHTLVATETHKTFHDPKLFTLDGKLAIAWSSGTIIYICGGCITDYDLNLLLVDPATVVPASPIATQLHNQNGITRPHLAVLGDDVHVIASLDFHALSYPAIGSFTCTAE